MTEPTDLTPTQQRLSLHLQQALEDLRSSDEDEDLALRFEIIQALDRLHGLVTDDDQD